MKKIHRNIHTLFGRYQDETIHDHVDMTGPSRQGLSVVSTIDHLMGAILEVCTLYGVLG